jgi:hypothetical protein
MTISTFKEFFEAVVENVRADIDDLPHGSMATWFPAPNGQPTVFKTGKVVPFDDGSKVYAIFQDDASVRVYTLGMAPPDPVPANWEGRAPTRYTLTKTAPTFVAETMTLEAMATEMAEEWNQIADGMNAADVELEAVIEYIEGMLEGATSDGMVPKTVMLTNLIDELREEAHRGDDLSDDEPETEPAASAASSIPTDAPAQEAPPS